MKKELCNKTGLSRNDLVSGGSKVPYILETIMQVDILALKMCIVPTIERTHGARPSPDSKMFQRRARCFVMLRCQKRAQLNRAGIQ